MDVRSEWSKVKSLSRVQLFATPWTVTHQAPPSMGLSRKEYWSGLPFPSPGDLPNPGIGPRFPTLQADALTSEPLDYKECWAPKNWCFWIVVLEKTVESLLDCKEIQPVHPKGNQSWIFIGKTDVEAETPILWPPDAKNWPTGKDPDAGKDWGQEKGVTGWDGWAASLTQWTGVSASSGSWWWTGKPGVLQSMVLQRVEHDWTTELTDSSK